MLTLNNHAGKDTSNSSVTFKMFYLNIKKTHTTFTILAASETDVTTFIDGTDTDTANQAKYLGVIIDTNINWSEHIKYTCNKISNSIGIFGK